MGRLILIEGLDLAGKSTLVQNLRTHFENRGTRVRYSRNGLCPDNPVAALADQIRRDPARTPLEGNCLFLAAHEWDLRHFQPPPRGGLHLQDSCWLRALAFDPGREALWRESMDRWPRFDGAIFLTASLAERQRRYFSRADNDEGDRWVFTEAERFLALEARLRALVLERGGREVDTTGLTAAEVLARVLLLLRPLQQLSA